MEIWILVLLILCSGFFEMSEMTGGAHCVGEAIAPPTGGAMQID